MSKLKKLVAEAIKEMKKDVDTAATKAVEASAPSVSAPKARVANTMKGMSKDAQRIGEIGYIVKTIRDGQLTETEVKELDARMKAIGVTGDISELLPSGFTGALIQDLRDQLVVTGLFPYKETAPGQYDSIALHGITGYLTSEATDGTDSAESYTTMMYLVEKCMAVVRKSYEALDDSLIPLAQEVRNGIVAALAEAIEAAVVSGDNSATHMDADVTAANDYRKAFKGIRKLGLGKATVDFGGAALTQNDWLKYISAMQEAGGNYLNDLEVSKGNVFLLVDQNVYNQLRMLDAFLTRDKAAGAATLFGRPVDSVFNIPVIMTPYLPTVNASGVVDSTAANNTKSAVYMVNKNYFKFYTTGTPLMETDKNIVNQSIIFTGSVRAGFSGVFDRKASDPSAIDATKPTIVAGVNIARI